MEECFVIMPISDQPGYETGHFKVVYDSIIKPACELANLIPIRADEVRTSSLIVLDVLKKLLECPMAICDVSSRNPNVMFELGIRQAFDKPVVLIKDSKTLDIFDIQGLRYFDYKSNLWPENINSSILGISQMLKSTYEMKEKFSLVSQLGITPAKSKVTIISEEAAMLLEAINSLKLNKGNAKFSLISEYEMIFEGRRYKAIDWVTAGSFYYLQYNELIWCLSFGFGKIVWVVKNGAGITTQIDVLFFSSGERHTFPFSSNFFKEVSFSE